MLEIDYINGPKSDKMFGMYKYQMEIRKRLDVILNVIEYESIMQNLEKRLTPPNNTDAKAQKKSDENSKDSGIKNFLFNQARKSVQEIDRYRYRLIVKNSIHQDNIKHLTNQELAYLLNHMDLDKTVVTCYDLIPWVYENDHGKYWKNIMTGLRKSDRIITISEFSKMEIMKELNYPEERIEIVSVAVDHKVYHPKRDKTILKRFNIPENQKTILYVGSETPRMNLDFLLKSLSKLKKTYPDFKLIKVGDPQSFGAREHFLNTIKATGLEKNVIFTGYVAEEELPKWYNAADLLVYPCLYAGFGVPPLEAMACGTPVITSNTSSLPEVVGNAGVMVDPNDTDAMSKSMFEVLTNESRKEELVQRGLKRSKLFQWDESANTTGEIYRELDQ
ncbi:glycosyl transferase group 1 [Methanobacterium lacus]|uniref:Glycosyl transferase group 1 n=1 Tax=Methanobacterium lacus (strain AL-21) TaxID=877455 RepID=F0TC68_METLA|nr:glycosyltransferase family 1 protein [Methanobacterium lacus]ADZ09219.1 glycosyl transferase group 1 [Methanobacterium lacus]